MSLTLKDLEELKEDLLKQSKQTYDALMQIEGAIKTVDLQLKKIKEKQGDEGVTNGT